jgi:hypothetical protein
MTERTFLVVMGIAWLPYGFYCLADPAVLARIAGVTASTPTGLTELRAMYGGLQAAIGLLALAATRRADLVRPALVALAFLFAGLASARLLGAVLDGAWSGYTLGGIVFETAGAGAAITLLRRG